MLPQLLTTASAITANCPKPSSGSFFGLVPWYGYLPSSAFGNPGANGSGPTDCTTVIRFQVLPGFNGNGPSDIPLVLLAVVDDLLRVAGLLAVGFVIYAAIQYIMSQGDSEKAAKAQRTIINALVGLVLAIVAVALVSFIGSSLK